MKIFVFQIEFIFYLNFIEFSQPTRSFTYSNINMSFHSLMIHSFTKCLYVLSINQWMLKIIDIEVKKLKFYIIYPCKMYGEDIKIFLFTLTQNYKFNMRNICNKIEMKWLALFYYVCLFSSNVFLQCVEVLPRRATGSIPK